MRVGWDEAGLIDQNINFSMGTRVRGYDGVSGRVTCLTTVDVVPAQAGIHGHANLVGASRLASLGDMHLRLTQVQPGCGEAGPAFLGRGADGKERARVPLEVTTPVDE